VQDDVIDDSHVVQLCNEAKRTLRQPTHSYRELQQEVKVPDCARELGEFVYVLVVKHRYFQLAREVLLIMSTYLAELRSPPTHKKPVPGFGAGFFAALKARPTASGAWLPTEEKAAAEVRCVLLCEAAATFDALTASTSPIGYSTRRPCSRETAPRQVRLRLRAEDLRRTQGLRA